MDGMDISESGCLLRPFLTDSSVGFCRLVGDLAPPGSQLGVIFSSFISNGEASRWVFHAEGGNVGQAPVA